MVSLHNFPRWDKQMMHLSYPFRRNGGYEFVTPPPGVPLITSRKGSATRKTFIRNKRTGKYLPTHPGSTEGSQWYWVVSVWCKVEQCSANTFYSRVCAWSTSLPSGVDPLDFCTDYVVHHFFKVRITWNHRKIWVNNDADAGDWVLETRAEHINRHLHDP